jgi:molybdate transport system substrate-binding protein
VFGLVFLSRRLPAILVAAAIAVTVATASCGSSQTPDETQERGGTAPIEVVVSAASDLAPVLEQLAPLFEQKTGLVLRTNLGSTGQLMEQIAAGAQVDVFLAASSSAIAQLNEKGLLVRGSSRLYARGQLVMWTPPGGTVTISTLQDLTSPGVTRIAIANPDHAPYGKAAREALQSAGLWDQLQPKLVPAENVRQAFQFAQSGNVDVGIVALSLVIDAGGSYTLIPEQSHQPINQTLAVIAASSHQAEAQAFTDFLTGPEGREILLKYGFVLPEE